LLNWNDGRLVILGAGQTAKCEGLIKGQLYAILIYNSSQTDVNAAVTVVWSNDFPPSTVTVRGSSGAGAPANFVFVSGSDTDFVAISLGPSSAASVTAFIVSVSMPLNTTGLNNAELPNNGQFQPFSKYDRYYMEAPSGWSSVTIENDLNQFICLQILESSAAIVVINMGAGISDGQVSIFGPTANASGTVGINKVYYQNCQTNIKPNSGTWVWMNGDNSQNSADARIALQQLSAVETLLELSGINRISNFIGRYFKG
jgi:hypothetical protein